MSPSVFPVFQDKLFVFSSGCFEVCETFFNGLSILELIYGQVTYPLQDLGFSKVIIRHWQRIVSNYFFFLIGN